MLTDEQINEMALPFCDECMLEFERRIAGEDIRSFARVIERHGSMAAGGLDPPPPGTAEGAPLVWTKIAGTGYSASKEGAEALFVWRPKLPGAFVFLQSADGKVKTGKTISVKTLEDAKAEAERVLDEFLRGEALPKQENKTKE